MIDTLIFDAVRTPRGKGKANSGSLTEVPPAELTAGVLRSLKQRNQLSTDTVEDIILGCVDPVMDQGADIARTAALISDYGETVPGLQINRFCASGLEAVGLATAKIQSGLNDLLIAGGVEMMSRVGMGGSGMPVLTDPSIAIPHYMVPQGISADLIATREGYSRHDVDSYALASQSRATEAWAKGYFSNSVIPVTDEHGLTILNHDEMIRSDVDLDKLAKLKPAFESMAQMSGLDTVAIQRYPDTEALSYVHHAGNSSQIVDGASAILMGSANAAKKHNLNARAKVRSVVSIGLDPTIMLTGPVEASKLAAKKCGMSLADIDVWEVNEAFASVVLFFMDKTGIPHDRINVNGGAIAMGHPLGATGAMILGTALDELERTGKGVAGVTLCAASGQAISMIIERI